MDILKSVESVFEAVEETRRAISGLTFEEFQMFLGIVVDQYEADHDMSIEETNGALEWLIVMRQAVYEKCGKLPKG